MVGGCAGGDDDGNGCSGGDGDGGGSRGGIEDGYQDVVEGPQVVVSVCQGGVRVQ